MLNITDNLIRSRVDRSEFTAFRLLAYRKRRVRMIRWVLGMTMLGIICLFLPWTQTVRGHGQVTALRPEQRPQSIPAIIGGRIDQWYVREGDTVQKGDTIIHISEIKDEYFDPQLLARTSEQVDAKRLALVSYQDKVKALDLQIRALEQGRVIKLRQTENKVRQARLKVLSDSTDWVAAKINNEVASDQFKRAQQMLQEGLVSLTDLESRKLKLQEASAKAISAENKYLGSSNELLNASAELYAVDYEYSDKLAKARSEKAASESAVYDGQATVAKLQNQLSTYVVRNGMYFITAPQDGYILKVAHSGIGETVKAGEDIVTIMPSSTEIAAEMFVSPVDLPLMHQDAKVRLVFDGWPALVFSGWPGISTGTYGGKVAAVDRNISSNGKYRLLVKQDPDEEPWPVALRMGGGVQSVALLNEVLVGYELWRRLNGFPPEFYKNKAEEKGKAVEKEGGKF